MKKYIILLLIIMCGVVYNSFSDNAVLEYLEGTLQKQVNGKWQNLHEGDIIPISSTLKAGNNVIAEISLGEKLITIYKKGTYTLENLVKESEEMETWDVSSLLARKIETAFVGTGDGSEGNMGVRSIKPKIIANAEEVGWYDPIALEFNEGYNAFQKGEYEKAAESFKKCLADATDAEKEECLFYLSYIYVLLRKTGLALKYFNMMKEDTNAYYFEEYAMIKGKLLIQVLDFGEALKVLQLAVKTYPKGRYLQDIYYLSAVCYNALNNTAKQKEYLKMAYDVDPSTAVGKSAKEQLESL
ncbi:MAG: tetratricopeptide repeat protein [Spirochaetales bacterium]|nr:tetratricopeptide repeat protein [Spirochaetales bacterium]